MKAWLDRFLSCAAAAALVSSCDPSWDVEGTIALAPEVDATQYRELVVLAEPTEAGVLVRAPIVAGQPQQTIGAWGTLGPETTGFPAHFLLGGGIGSVWPYRDLRLTAFLSKTSGELIAQTGDAADEAALGFESCRVFPYLKEDHCGWVILSMTLQPVP